MVCQVSLLQRSALLSPAAMCPEVTLPCTSLSAKPDKLVLHSRQALPKYMVPSAVWYPGSGMMAVDWSHGSQLPLAAHCPLFNSHRKRLRYVGSAQSPCETTLTRNPAQQLITTGHVHNMHGRCTIPSLQYPATTKMHSLAFQHSAAL